MNTRGFPSSYVIDANAEVLSELESYGSFLRFNPFGSQLKSTDVDGNGFVDVIITSSQNINILYDFGEGIQIPIESIYSTQGFQSTQSPPMTTGDFNADGLLDVVLQSGVSTSSSGEEELSIMFGSNTYEFISQTTVPLGNIRTNSLKSLDFNNDGVLDFVASISVASTEAPKLRIFIGNGNLTFNTSDYEINFSVGESASFIEVGDFNADSNLDIAVLNGVGNEIDLLWGDGTGNVVESETLFVGQRPNGLVWNDFNNDGILDLATANLLDDEISLLLGVGGGSFLIAQNYPTDQNPRDIVSGDFNGDNFADIATAGDKISILLNDGSGGFTNVDGFSYLKNGGNTSLEVSDFNNDGKLDLASQSGKDELFWPPGPIVNLFYGNGDGNFVNTEKLLYYREVA